MNFSNKDIQIVGAMEMVRKDNLTLSSGDMEGQWESLKNIRLKKDGPYPYWQLRGGLTKVKDLSANILSTKGFEARIGPNIKKYIAAHLDNGNIVIYNIDAHNADYTIPGFSDDPIQYHQSGHFLYFFDGTISKYIDLSNGTISDFGNLRSTPILSYEKQSQDDIESLFPIRNGDRVIVFPPVIEDFDDSIYTYGFYEVENGVPVGGGIGPLSAPPLQLSASGANNYDWNDKINNQGKEYSFNMRLRPYAIYKIKKGSCNIDVLNTFIDNLDTSNPDSEGYVYFSVESGDVAIQFLSETVDFINAIWPDIRFIAPNDLDPDKEFYSTRLGKAGTDENGDYVVLDSGDKIYRTEDSAYTFARMDKVLDASIDQVFYSVTRSAFSSVLIDYNYADLTIDFGDPAEGTHHILSYTYTGGEFPVNDPTVPSTGDTSSFYRQFVIVDVLNDGSVCLPGKPVSIDYEINTDVAGVLLDVKAARPNVAKRFLCTTRFMKNEKAIFSPTSEDYDNSPLFVSEELDIEKTTVFSYGRTNNDIRPITEIIPMAAGIPTLFGHKQITPKTIASFDQTIAIAGYTIHRPIPNIYTDLSNEGNIFIDKSGIATSKSVYVYFQYSDGSYSRKVTEPLFDEYNTVTIHGLNTLVSNIHIYISDGTEDYFIKTISNTDAEFCGYSFNVSADVTNALSSHIPNNLNVVEDVDLGNYLTIPIPAQNIQISSQAKIFGNSSIVGIIPLDYDNYRNPLRYRVQVFTNDNIQVGYITELQQESIISYDAKFEITDASRRAKTARGINRVGQSVFFQDDQGVSVSDGGNINLIIDRYHYPIANKELTDVVFYEPDGEVWFLFNDDVVIVLDIESNKIRRFEYINNPIISSDFFNSSLFIATGNSICKAENGGSDLGTTIKGTSITTYMGDNGYNTELREVCVYGENSEVTILIDDQPQRNRYANSFDGFDFSSQESIGPKQVDVNGSCVRPLKNGSKLRVGFEFTGQETRIEEIVAKLFVMNKPM